MWEWLFGKKKKKKRKPKGVKVRGAQIDVWSDDGEIHIDNLKGGQVNIAGGNMTQVNHFHRK